MSSIYLDYNATTPIRPEVLQLVTYIMGEVGNGSSVHQYGQKARKHIEDARSQVAALCNTLPEQVVFTSGATESNNTILRAYHDSRVLVSAIEHPAVLQSAPHAEIIPVTRDGLIDVDAYKELLEQSPAPAIVSIMYVNSETGVIQPIKELAELAHAKGALFHTDAVQAAGRFDLDINDIDVDYISLSAHKMAGPQGVGAVVYKKGVELSRFMMGGGQEKNCRAGTHNTAGIAGMGLAAKLAKENIEHYTEVQKLRDHLESEIHKISNKAVIYGEGAPRVANTCNVGLSGVPAQTQMMQLDLSGIAVSSGSACSSGSFKPSHVLTAMGVSDEDAKSALRISLGWATTSDEINRFLDAWKKIAQA